MSPVHVGSETWRPTHEVAWSIQDGLAALLSLRTWRYTQLDAVASDVWQCLVRGASVDEIVQTLIETYEDAEETVVRHDVIATLRELETRRLAREEGDSPARRISVTSAAVGGPPKPLPGRFIVWLWLHSCYVRLRLFGYSSVVRGIQASEPARSERNDALRAAAYRVRVASTFSILPTACLEESLCLLWMLKRAGHPATIRVGVQACPFRAHAWVECDGQPVGEDPFFLRTYAPMTIASL